MPPILKLLSEVINMSDPIMDKGRFPRNQSPSLVEMSFSLDISRETP